jgi:nucleoid DNA-binding protein
MGEYFSRLPKNIQIHVREITKSSGLPEGDESLELISRTWMEKKLLFEEQIRSLHMEEVPTLPQEDPRGALLLTYSGSLLSMGPPFQGERLIEYASIGLRKDVPASLHRESARPRGSILVDHVLGFESGPIKQSSPILKIAVCPQNVPSEEQEKRIREATIFLTNGFIKINRTYISPDERLPDQFTMKTMVSYVAAKNDISQKIARQILEDYTQVVESGVLLGAQVPFGKIGRLSIKKRGAQRARVVKNPATGEEITVKAKPESYVPKIRFSSTFREKARLLKLGETG